MKANPGDLELTTGIAVHVMVSHKTQRAKARQLLSNAQGLSRVWKERRLWNERCTKDRMNEQHVSWMMVRAWDPLSPLPTCSPIHGWTGHLELRGYCKKTRWD